MIVILSGATWSAVAIVGTAVLRIVVSSDSIKNATAISHGSTCLLEAAGGGCEKRDSIGLGVLKSNAIGMLPNHLRPSTHTVSTFHRSAGRPS